LGLNRPPGLEPKSAAPRCEYKAPGETIHLDLKKSEKTEGVGHRIHGDRCRRSCGAGWELLYVGRRLQPLGLWRDITATTAGRFLIRAVAWLKGQGVTVRRVMSDNEGCYPGQSLGARHIRTRP